MKKSLCCISLKLQKSGFKSNTMTKTRFLMLERNEAVKTVSKRTLNNVYVTKKTIAYCAKNNWNYRISSDLFPLATLPEANLSFNVLPDKQFILDEFKNASDIIKSTKIRCSTHPDQFVVPASFNPDVSAKSIVELKNHATIMDLFGLPQSYDSPINIHMNCYKNKPKEAAKRFIDVYDTLPFNVKSRLVLENEDKPNSWSVQELYDLIYQQRGIPITFDNLHHRCNPKNLNINDAIKLCISTWGKFKPLFHFSDSDPKNKNPRAHADYVQTFPDEYKDLDVDFEFEFKAKDYAIEKFENDYKI